MAYVENRSPGPIIDLREHEQPASAETEQALLGAILLDNALYERISDLVTAETFYEGYGSLHKDIFDVMAGWIPQGKVVNAMTLKAQLGDRDLGGTTLSQYLAAMRADPAIPSEIRGYAKILRDLYIRRRLIGIGHDTLLRAVYAGPDDTAKSLVDGMLQRISELPVDPDERTGFEGFDAVALRSVRAAEAAFQSEDEMIGLPTGLPRLDDLIGGLRQTDLIVLAGRPAMGKSALAGQIGFAAAQFLQRRRDAGRKTGVVAVFSLEMSKEQFVERLVCSEANVPPWKIRRKRLTAEDITAMEATRREIGKLPFRIDATPALNVMQIGLKAKALAKRHGGLELLVVDYLQIMGSLSRSDNRAREIGDMTKGLKALAKELDVPVVVLSQLNRGLENRDDKRPTLVDLKESGDIEQDADIVMFVYRDEYYLPAKAPPEGSDARLRWERRKAAVAGIAEIIVGKNRHGPTGTVELGFDGAMTRFLNEPPPRDDSIEPERPKVAEVKLGKYSLAMLRILQDQVSHLPAKLADPLPGVPGWVDQALDYEILKSECLAKFSDPTWSDVRKARMMVDNLGPLVANGYVGRGGTKERAWVWLCERGKRHG